jgi:membrane-associated protein
VVNLNYPYFHSLNKIQKFMNNFEWTQLVNPEFYITFTIGGIQLGLYIVLFIVFAETGLFAGFFLPGDSLLFLAGIYSRDLVQNILFIESDFINLVILSTLVALAGVFGNMVGYWFGAKSGYYLYNREDTLLFKKKYLIQSKEFFEKHGGKAIIYARFLPIVRTFAPIVAGIGTMDRKKFMFFNIVSSFLWSFILIFSGHYLYGMFLEMGIDLKEHIEKIVIGIILVSTLPVLLKVIKKKVVHQ